MSHRPRTRTVLSCGLLLVPLAVSATACGGSDSETLSGTPYDAAGQITANPPAGTQKADPDKPLEVSVKGNDARITDVTATDTTGRFVRGELSADGRHWRTTAPLAAGSRYTVRVSTEEEDGSPGRKTLVVNTRGADGQLTATFGPKEGEYGVGQPVTAELNQPVKDPQARAVVESALKVDSMPRVQGSWHWVDDKKLHFRPKEYWPAHATISVHSNLAGLKVAKGLYGGPSKPVKLTTGDRVEAITDAATHQMTVLRNGESINTIPVTTGKPGFSTRNGVKVVLGKESFVRMRSSTVGIAAGSGDSYDLPVYWATRVTWSGEYVHAAPWSVGSQGAANVSHGCTGMSTSNAQWFFNHVRIGDIVKVVNSSGDTMTPFDNGFGDWNMPWQEWREGSALKNKAATTTGAAGRLQDPADNARLRPKF
ncbi:Ig-like domain-containing protein [Streptomyces sp. DSM 41527]|uniref:Ig-like domain-containing protein n=1 Tax=Streptomyces mooreae TaxID=3075523 RepID=A0ABU2TFX9_9ACTN|nr:Ig-like domain-containing protein [Streptomyces sp. DSM 41527]MDT0459843.1 Ig-like domain-containing protein [Streptomyces sp. DSM 41527]